MCSIIQVLKKKGKTIYELYYVPDSQGYENDKPLKSIGSSFENVIQETNMLLDNNFNLQDILASSFTDKDKDKEEERQVVERETSLSYPIFYFDISSSSFLETQSRYSRDRSVLPKTWI